MLVFIVVAILVVTLGACMYQFWNWRIGKRHFIPPRLSLMLAAGSTLMLFEVFVKTVD